MQKLQIDKIYDNDRTCVFFEMPPGKILETKYMKMVDEV